MLLAYTKGTWWPQISAVHPLRTARRGENYRVPTKCPLYFSYTAFLEASLNHFEPWPPKTWIGRQPYPLWALYTNTNPHIPFINIKMECFFSTTRWFAEKKKLQMHPNAKTKQNPVECLICGSKPMSNIRSASSTTKNLGRFADSFDGSLGGDLWTGIVLLVFLEGGVLWHLYLHIPLWKAVWGFTVCRSYFLFLGGEMEMVLFFWWYLHAFMLSVTWYVFTLASKRDRFLIGKTFVQPTNTRHLGVPNRWFLCCLLRYLFHFFSQDIFEIQEPKNFHKHPSGQRPNVFFFLPCKSTLLRQLEELNKILRFNGSSLWLRPFSSSPMKQNMHIARNYIKGPKETKQSYIDHKNTCKTYQKLIPKQNTYTNKTKTSSHFQSSSGLTSFMLITSNVLFGPPGPPLNLLLQGLHECSNNMSYHVGPFFTTSTRQNKAARPFDILSFSTMNL